MLAIRAPLDPNAVHLAVRGELVDPLASQLEPFDKAFSHERSRRVSANGNLPKLTTLPSIPLLQRGMFDQGKVRLAAFLLGIRDPEHLSIHASRGALFENFVISEPLKKRFNAGLSANLYFWRNNIGDEIDIIIEQGNKLQPIEIKSAQTIAPQFMFGLNKWMEIAEKSALPPQLVYGGTESMTRNGVQIMSWQAIKDHSG